MAKKCYFVKLKFSGILYSKRNEDTFSYKYIIWLTIVVKQILNFICKVMQDDIWCIIPMCQYHAVF